MWDPLIILLLPVTDNDISPESKLKCTNHNNTTTCSLSKLEKLTKAGLVGPIRATVARTVEPTDEADPLSM